MVVIEKIRSLVGVFYQPEFKTFYVNSKDGKSFCSPLGVFVSLGMTTSLKVLENICKVLNDSNEFSARLVEMGSKKVDGQFLNTILNDTEPRQYRLSDFCNVDLLDKESAEQELKELRDNLNPSTPLDTLKVLAIKASRLQYFTEKLNESDGWGAHLIQKVDDDYRIYHLFVNYQREGDVEKRLGIYVTEKQSND